MPSLGVFAVCKKMGKVWNRPMKFFKFTVLNCAFCLQSTGYLVNNRSFTLHGDPCHPGKWLLGCCGDPFFRLRFSMT